MDKKEAEARPVMGTIFLVNFNCGFGGVNLKKIFEKFPLVV